MITAPMACVILLFTLKDKLARIYNSHGNLTQVSDIPHAEARTFCNMEVLYGRDNNSLPVLRRASNCEMVSYHVLRGSQGNRTYSPWYVCCPYVTPKEAKKRNTAIFIVSSLQLSREKQFRQSLARNKAQQGVRIVAPDSLALFL